MELLADCALNDLVMLVLVQLSCVFEVQLVVVGVRLNNFRLLHVHGDRQNSLQREVRVFNVVSYHLCVLVEQVRVFKLDNRFLGDLGDPIVHAQSAVLQNHLLHVFEVESLVVVRLQILEQLSNVFFLVHDVSWLRQIECLYHDLRCRPLFDCQKLEKVLLVDFANHFTQLDIRVYVLPTTATCQVHELVDVVLALLTQILIQHVNVPFL